MSLKLICFFIKTGSHFVIWQGTLSSWCSIIFHISSVAIVVEVQLQYVNVVDSDWENVPNRFVTGYVKTQVLTVIQ